MVNLGGMGQKGLYIHNRNLQKFADFTKTPRNLMPHTHYSVPTLHLMQG